MSATVNHTPLLPTVRTSPVLVTGEAPERAAVVRAERLAQSRRTTLLWAVAAMMLGVAAAAGSVAAVVHTVVLPIHI